MTWAFLIANLKWVVLGALGLWAAKEIKESGRKSEKLKLTESQNKALINEKQYFVSAAKRSEEETKKARDYAHSVERILSEKDPTALTKLQLDRLSEDPLSFTEIKTKPGEDE